MSEMTEFVRGGVGGPWECGWEAREMFRTMRIEAGEEDVSDLAPAEEDGEEQEDRSENEE